MTQQLIVQAILSQPEARRRVAYIFENGRINGTPKEINISDGVYYQMLHELPVVYEEAGYAKFDVDEQVELARELDAEFDETVAEHGTPDEHQEWRDLQEHYEMEREATR